MSISFLSPSPTMYLLWALLRRPRQGLWLLHSLLGLLRLARSLLLFLRPARRQPFTHRLNLHGKGRNEVRKGKIEQQELSPLSLGSSYPLAKRFPISHGSKDKINETTTSWKDIPCCRRFGNFKPMTSRF